MRILRQAPLLEHGIQSGARTAASVLYEITVLAPLSHLEVISSLRSHSAGFLSHDSPQEAGDGKNCRSSQKGLHRCRSQLLRTHGPARSGAPIATTDLLGSEMDSYTGAKIVLEDARKRRSEPALSRLQSSDLERVSTLLGYYSYHNSADSKQRMDDVCKTGGDTTSDVMGSERKRTCFLEGEKET